MTKSAGEMFNVAFEEAVLPVMDELMIKDYENTLKSGDDFCGSEAEFIKFRGAFEQRIKLFYFRQFTKYRAEGREKIFPGSVDQVKKDMSFLYVEFKSFLKEQRTKIK